MKSMVQFIKLRGDITFGNFDIEGMNTEEYRESLKTNVGNNYAGESNLLFLFKKKILEKLNRKGNQDYLIISKMEF